MSQSLIRPLMRLAALVVAIIATALAAKAQNQPYALLTHNGETRIFSGTDAAAKANNAAEDGDIITLSEGVFNQYLTIKKSITVRGYDMTLSGGGSRIAIIEVEPEKADAVITIEGINITDGYRSRTNYKCSVSFNKCCINRFDYISGGYYSVFLNISECIIYRDLPVEQSTIVNSIIKGNGGVKTSTIVNSIIEGDDGLSHTYTAKNCIFTNWGRSEIHNGLTAENCVFVLNFDNDTEGAVRKITGTSPTSKVFAKGTTVFKEGAGFYELTDENATNWLGSDGTQVGIHGGELPFRAAASTPQLILNKVDTKTNPDGTLNVELGIDF